MFLAEEQMFLTNVPGSPRVEPDGCRGRADHMSTTPTDLATAPPGVTPARTAGPARNVSKEMCRDDRDPDHHAGSRDARTGGLPARGAARADPCRRRAADPGRDRKSVV